MLGTWEIAKMKKSSLPEKVASGFSEATKNLKGAKYRPVLYCGKQIVAGTNHMIICKQTLSDREGTEHVVAMMLHQPLPKQGKKWEIVSITPIVQGLEPGRALRRCLVARLVGGSFEVPQGVRATRLFVAGGDAKRTRGVTMTPQEPYLAPRACRFDDKRGYVKSSARVGDAEPMAASDVAFLAPELVSEAEGPVPVPAPAEGRLGYRFVKRAFDIAFSLCAIAVLLVPSIILCVAIRLESPGCPIYSQKRVGRIGRSGEVRTFDMYKFRSMHKDADERLFELQELNEADGPLFKIKDDPRVTRIGKFIRKHSIDELPQFLNCLMGQLSCVGPRPPLPSEVAQYDERAMRRLSVKPGLTGYWQVRGRSDTTFDDMVAMDLAYIEERSFLVDLKVIAKTVVTMLDGKGAC